MPGIVTGAIMAFTISIDDFVVSTLRRALPASRFRSSSTRWCARRISPKINAVSTILFVCILILLLVINIRQTHAMDPKRRAAAVYKKRSRPIGKCVLAGVLCLFLVGGPLWGLLRGGASEEQVVNVYNWGEYMDESLLEQFEAETGYQSSIRLLTPMRACMPGSRPKAMTS